MKIQMLSMHYRKVEFCFIPNLKSLWTKHAQQLMNYVKSMSFSIVLDKEKYGNIVSTLIEFSLCQYGKYWLWCKSLELSWESVDETKMYV